MQEDATKMSLCEWPGNIQSTAGEPDSPSAFPTDRDWGPSGAKVPYQWPLCRYSASQDLALPRTGETGRQFLHDEQQYSRLSDGPDRENDLNRVLRVTTRKILRHRCELRGRRVMSTLGNPQMHRAT